jgi:hypothetical protein
VIPILFLVYGFMYQVCGEDCRLAEESMVAITAVHQISVPARFAGKSALAVRRFGVPEHASPASCAPDIN